VVLSLVLLPAALAAQGFTITGRVTDAASHAPVANAQLVVLKTSAQARTGPDGRYRLVVPSPPAVRGGKVTVAVARLGYAHAERGVTLDSAGVTADFALVASTVGLEALVVQSAGVVAQSPGARRREAGYAARVRGQTAAVQGTTAIDAHHGMPAPRDPGADEYGHLVENRFLSAARTPLSTFSTDADAASYANVRSYITQGSAPPPDAVRIEEMVNYFPYDYRQPAGDAPFSVASDVAECPWNHAHRLVRIGLQARRVEESTLPPSSLVFLVDVSGSMNDETKLPLVQASLRMLVERLRPQDRVALVAYAGNAGLVLPSTPGSEKRTITEAIDRLRAGGSTAGGAGIQLAYDVARGSFLPGGNNRVILATDGDFNVGVSSEGELVRLVERRRSEGTFLTVLGFGMGNLKDRRMEQLADHGNGNYAYVDGPAEARKVLVTEMGGTLHTVAKDVKLQVEFNPARVASYRLIGYENRLLRDEEFNDDTRDAGEIGAGHAVTALYEVVPAGASVREAGSVDPLRYQRAPSRTAVARGAELMTVKVRYKAPQGTLSRVLSFPVEDGGGSMAAASADFRFAAAVAELGLLLRASEFKGAASAEDVVSLAGGALGSDPNGYRAEFLDLAQSYARISREGIARR
jgi:Ca-activated chloride channel family protein